MPPVSQAQRRLMHAAANNPAIAKKTGVPVKVAKEFADADKPGKLPARVKEGKPVSQSRAKDAVSPRPRRPAAGRPARGRGL